MIRAWSILAGAVSAAGLSLCGTGLAQNSVIVAGGWSLADIGHKPGDDSERVVSIEKVLPEIDLVYRPGETNKGGSISVTFNGAGCQKLNLSSGFDLPDGVGDRVVRVCKEIHEAFDDYIKTCKSVGSLETNVMEGFDQAFAAVDKLIADKPNIYPPEPAAIGNRQ